MEATYNEKRIAILKQKISTLKKQLKQEKKKFKKVKSEPISKKPAEIQYYRVYVDMNDDVEYISVVCELQSDVPLNRSFKLLRPIHNIISGEKIEIINEKDDFYVKSIKCEKDEEDYDPEDN